MSVELVCFTLYSSSISCFTVIWSMIHNETGKQYDSSCVSQWVGVAWPVSLLETATVYSFCISFKYVTCLQSQCRVAHMLLKIVLENTPCWHKQKLCLEPNTALLLIMHLENEVNSMAAENFHGFKILVSNVSDVFYWFSIQPPSSRG